MVVFSSNKKGLESGGHFRHLKELYEAGELTDAINRIVEDINHRFVVDVLTRRFSSHDLGSAADMLMKTTDADRAQGREYGSKWIGHRVADCSGLFSWAFRQLGGSIYHGSDTMYRKFCVNKGELNKGKRTDRGTLKPGTAVFVWNGSSYSHVGLYAGSGIVIEAMSTLKGVTTTKVTAGKWTHWGEVTGVDYAGDNAELRMQNAELNAENRLTIRRGRKGETVAEMQGIHGSASFL